MFVFISAHFFDAGLMVSDADVYPWTTAHLGAGRGVRSERREA